MHSKVGRNDLCPCGSGLKHKNCCLKHNPPPRSSPNQGTSKTTLFSRPVASIPNPIKFTAKVIKSGPEEHKSETEEKKAPQKDYYTTLMERAFGPVIYTENAPPIPLDPSVYLVEEEEK